MLILYVAYTCFLDHKYTNIFFLFPHKGQRFLFQPIAFKSEYVEGPLTLHLWNALVPTFGKFAFHRWNVNVPRLETPVSTVIWLLHSQDITSKDHQ